jgi:HK97 family phage prohead protease
MSGASNFETRDASSAFTVDENANGRITIRGTPIVFNSWSRVMYDPRIGQFRELIRPEAVDRTLTSAKEIHAYWNHQSGDVLGNTLAGSLLLRKTPANIAMELYPTSEWMGTPQAAAVKRGDVRGMSFGFGIMDDGDVWSDRPDDDGVWNREIVDMDFSEVSIVGRPAYPQTTVNVSQRSMETFQAIQAAGSTVEYLRMVHRNRLAGL